MKRLIAVLTAFVMIFSMIPMAAGFAFAAEEPEAAEPVITPDGAIPGGWTYLTDTTITERAQNAFDKAFDGFTGSIVEPKELLATQVVAGTNYRFRCEVTGVYPGAVTKTEDVVIYEDLQGNCTISEFIELTATDNAAEVKIAASTKLVKVKKTGKNAVRISWTGKDGQELGYDGYIVYRSTSKNGKYTKIYTTKKTTYLNTNVKPGKKYFYKVKGYKTVDGEKVYSKYSNKAYRTVK